jgi:hypothetical protein
MSRSAFEAVVQVGEQETPYLCCGRGAPLVVLAATPAEQEALVHLLADHFRVIAVVPPVAEALGEDPDCAGWLRSVIDGLGLTRPRLLLSEHFATHAAAAAAAVPEGTVIVAGAGMAPGDLLAAAAADMEDA